MAEKYLRTTKGGIEYTLSFKDVRKINMRIREGKLFVSAPLRSRASAIDGMVDEKSDWIKPKLYNKNDSVQYLLGERYIIEHVPGKKSGISVLDGVICIHCADENDVMRIYTKWKAETALGIFEKAVSDVLPLFDGIKGANGKTVKMPVIEVRNIKSAWGKCYSTRGKVVFALMLADKSYEVIKYVAAHELCHFIYPDHQKGFHELLDRVMPDGRRLNRELNKVNL